MVQITVHLMCWRHYILRYPRCVHVNEIKATSCQGAIVLLLSEMSVYMVTVLACNVTVLFCFVCREGGIRGNAFVSGGYLQTHAPARVGSKIDGMTHICDWYATFAHLAGADPKDHKAAKAFLPPIDSLNLWPYLSGAVAQSPRTEIFADPDTLIIGNWKLVGANVANACGKMVAWSSRVKI